MRIRGAVVLGLATLACGYLPGAAPRTAARKKTTSRALAHAPALKKTAAKKKTAPRKRPAAPVPAAERVGAAGKVDGYLAESATAPFQQPAALAPFFERLLRLGSKQDAAPVHIIHFGDSHTAADEWTGGLRDRFRDRFGDGGSGFSLAGRPFLGYRRFDARGGATTGWHSEGLRSATGDGWFGLGGVSISTDLAGQSVFLQAECDHLEIQYLVQPGGGRIALYDGDQRVDEISTAGEVAPGFARYDSSAGPHRFTLKTLDHRPVRLFGWAADKNAGVTYEALGINGAEAGVILKWDEAMLATYLQRRQASMIVLAYGTNEASDSLWRTESYSAMFARLVARLRAAAPEASILVLGPADRWWMVRGRWQLVPGIDAIIADQRKVCRDLGCAYWDTRQRMGGAGAMRDWLYAGLAQGDRVHFNTAGYRRLAAELFTDLMRQYEAYCEARLDSANDTSHDRANTDR